MTQFDRAAKAEALLLRFAAEAHRRKWDYDRGLDNDGAPLKSEAFDALHQLGEEMRTALEELRRMAGADQPAASASVQPPTRTDVLREAADELGRMDYDTDSNDYGYDTYRDAWNGGVMDAADLLRRMAGEEQPATEARCSHGCDTSVCPCLACEAEEPECTCAAAGDCFAPAGHYADCPAAAVARQDGAAS